MLAPPKEPRRPRDSTLERRRELFRDAIRLIERDYSRRLSLDEAARELATSRRQLQRVLADFAGTGFRDLVLRVRMWHARQMLSDTDESVREIARRLGYREASDFPKAFHRYHGVSPSHYRERREDDGAGA